MFRVTYSTLTLTLCIYCTKYVYDGQNNVPVLKTFHVPFLRIYGYAILGSKEGFVISTIFGVDMPMVWAIPSSVQAYSSLCAQKHLVLVKKP